MSTERQAAFIPAERPDAVTALETVIRAINGGSTEAVRALAAAVADEHPTLSGQLGKAVAIGLVRRATYNPDWTPFQSWEGPDCDEQEGLSAELGVAPAHPAHDGRHSCWLIAGAVMMARQFYV